jgi:hypothetical protein
VEKPGFSTTCTIHFFHFHIVNETIEEIEQNNVNVLVTGVTVTNDFTKYAHEFA